VKCEPFDAPCRFTRPGGLDRFADDFLEVLHIYIRYSGCGNLVTIPITVRKLKIQLLPTGPRYGVDLVDHQPILLGRDTTPNLPNTVSGCQLELTPFEGKLLLRHLDGNPALIQKDATWYSLNEYWMPISDLAASSVTPALTDVHIGIELK